MKKLAIIFLSAISISLHSGCEEIESVLPSGLTNEEVIEGLKSALNVGTDTSVNILSMVDGYYKDELVKILLPDEASVIVNSISSVPGGTILLDETIKAINRSAEDAAKEATPIFKNAIKNITIADGFSILNGANDAATIYLKENTSDSLYHKFYPKISASLNKEFIGISAESAYANLKAAYNAVAPILGKPKVSSNNLSQHTTNKALDGLFLKVADEEHKIRTDINHRVNDILQKVFGSK